MRTVHGRVCLGVVPTPRHTTHPPPVVTPRRYRTPHGRGESLSLSPSSLLSPTRQWAAASTNGRRSRPGRRRLLNGARESIVDRSIVRSTTTTTTRKDYYDIITPPLPPRGVIIFTRHYVSYTRWETLSTRSRGYLFADFSRQIDERHARTTVFVQYPLSPCDMDALLFIVKVIV